MRKTTFITSCLFSLVALGLVGCSKTPTCDSDEAKKLVIESALAPKNEIKSFILLNNYKQRDSYKQCTQKVPENYGDPRWWTNNWNCSNAESAAFEKLTPVFSLSNIILQAKNDDVHSVACTATLTGKLEGWGDGEIGIRYKLQRNTEGALVTTVSGM